MNYISFTFYDKTMNKVVVHEPNFKRGLLRGVLRKSIFGVLAHGLLHLVAK